MLYLFLIVACVAFVYSLLLIWLHFVFPELDSDHEEPLDGIHV